MYGLITDIYEFHNSKTDEQITALAILEHPKVHLIVIKYKMFFKVTVEHPTQHKLDLALCEARSLELYNSTTLGNGERLYDDDILNVIEQMIKKMPDREKSELCKEVAESLFKPVRYYDPFNTRDELIKDLAKKLDLID